VEGFTSFRLTVIGAFNSAIVSPFPPSFRGLLFVDVLSVTNLENDHDHPIIYDFVDDAMLPHSDAVYVIVTFKLSGAAGSRSSHQAANRFN